MSRHDGFILIVPRDSLPALLNALARRADGGSAFWFPIEDGLAKHADATRRANGRDEGLIDDTTVHVRRGVFYGLVTLSTAAPELRQLFEVSKAIKLEMLRIVREAGGGLVLLAQVPGKSYERVDTGDVSATDIAPKLVDEFADTFGMAELVPPSRRR